MTTTHGYPGSKPARQSVGLPGHCDRCAMVGHVKAHPSLGCGDVGCNAAHGPTPNWWVRAERLLEHALDELRSDGGDTALQSASAAVVAMHIAFGDRPAIELEGYPFPGEAQPSPMCICPAALVGRGGFKSTCPAVHLAQ